MLFNFNVSFTYFITLVSFYLLFLTMSKTCVLMSRRSLTRSINRFMLYAILMIREREVMSDVLGSNTRICRHHLFSITSVTLTPHKNTAGPLWSQSRWGQFDPSPEQSVTRHLKHLNCGNNWTQLRLQQLVDRSISQPESKSTRCFSQTIIGFSYFWVKNVQNGDVSRFSNMVNWETSRVTSGTIIWILQQGLLRQSMK